MIKSLNSAAFVLIIILGWSFKGAAQTDSVQVSAQTNFFPVLKCASNVVYTNATILRVTPAEASVSFDGGIAKVPLQNLPEFLRQRYHYNPTNAAQYALAEKARAKARKLAEAAQAAEQEKLDAANRGNLCTIQVEQIEDNQFGYLKCVVSEGWPRGGGGGADASVPSEVLLMNLPDSVRKTVTQIAQQKIAIEQQKTAIENVRNQKIVATSRVNDPNDPDPGFTAQMNAQSALYNAQQVQYEKLDDMKASLEDMKADLKIMRTYLPDKTQVTAYFTGKSYANFQIWECVQN
jgi:hypothetical protein